MKHLILLSISFFCLNSTVLAQLKSEVNECFELTSIVFRLAGAPEYSSCQIPGYALAIDTYFDRYRNHKLILFAKEIRQNNGIGYSAVSSTANLLEIKNGNVGIIPGVDISEIDKTDNRWSEQTFKTYVAYLDDFYKKTKFRRFYTQHNGLYKLAAEKLDEKLKDINIGWFESFFGEDGGNLSVIVSLCNGTSNYFVSSSVHSVRDAIVIGSLVDQQGLPAYENAVSVIIHELSHRFTNPRIVNCWEQISAASRKIYSYVEEDMRKNAYGSARTTIMEWFTNLASVLYFQDNPSIYILVPYLIRENQDKGFIWLERSIAFMEYFKRHRNQFATIDDYMPHIIGFINYTADNFDQVVDEYKNSRPYLSGTFPVSGSTVVMPTDTVEFYFSEPMLDAHGIRPVNDEGIQDLPVSAMPFWKDEYTYVVPVDKALFEEGKTYGIELVRGTFQSKRTHIIKGNLVYTLKIGN